MAHPTAKAIFANAGCGGCHTFQPAGATGTIGPDLDDLAAAAEQAGQPLDEFVRESIVDPDATVTGGFQPGVMPKTFGQSLTPTELDALVTFLSGRARREHDDDRRARSAAGGPRCSRTSPRGGAAS